MIGRSARACASLFVAACCGVCLAQDDPTEDVQSLALQWTSLERQRNLLESNWRAEQPVLEQQLALLERERAELSAFLEQTETAQDEVEERRLELLERQSELERQQASLELELEAAIIQVQSLHRQLPPPLTAGWDVRMAELRAEFLTTSERLQVLLEMLGDLDDFDRRISLHEETMMLADGQEHLVNEVYLGLAQGWYVSANGSFAGIGSPGANGWEWRTTDEPEAIERVIAILERRRNVELVALPVELGGAR
jgi:chromosome segregation ATPase